MGITIHQRAIRKCNALWGLFSVIMLTMGCAASQVALEKKDLKLETLMSQTVFMDVEHQTKKTVFVDVRNTSDKDVDFVTTLRNSIKAKGYTLVNKAHGAAYVFQINVLYVGQADPIALRTAVHQGYGGSWNGGAIGYFGYGKWTDAFFAGALRDMLGWMETVSGSIVKDVTYTVMTDVQLKENTTEEGTKHRVRVAATANKVNLKWEEAQAPLVTNLGKSLGGML